MLHAALTDEQGQRGCSSGQLQPLLTGNPSFSPLPLRSELASLQEDLCALRSSSAAGLERCGSRLEAVEEAVVAVRGQQPQVVASALVVESAPVVASAPMEEIKVEIKVRPAGS